MTRARAGLLAAALLALAPSVALAQQLHWPPEAERRFQDAIQLARKGQHKEAAAVYREIADWPDGGDWKERPRALHAAAMEWQAAHELGKALATYREVVTRFPRSDFVAVAERAAKALEPDGVTGGLDFQKRWSEALDVLLPARTRHDRGDLDGARPGLEEAETLLAALLRDHEDHPKAVDVALAESETLARLRRYDEADALAERGVTLAEREAAKGTNDATRADLARARQQRADVRREVRLRLAAGAGALGLLAALFLGVASLRPWRRATRRLVRLAIGLAVADALLAAVAAGGAIYVRLRDDPDSLLSAPMAVALVLVPGACGIALALGYNAGLGGRRGAFVGALAGVLGALAASLILMHQFRFDRLLPAF